MQQSVTLQATQTVVAEADVTFVIVEMRTEQAAILEGELRSMLEPMIAVT